MLSEAQIERLAKAIAKAVADVLAEKPEIPADLRRRAQAGEIEIGRCVATGNLVPIKVEVQNEPSINARTGQFSYHTIFNVDGKRIVSVFNGEMRRGEHLNKARWDQDEKALREQGIELVAD